MPRIRTNSASMGLFVGPTPATGTHASGSIKPIYRLTALTNSWSDSKNDIVVYGKTAAIGRERINPPEVSFDFSYYLTDFENEASLGFVVDGVNSALGNILNESQDEKNYFVLVTPEGVDASGSGGGTSGAKVVGFGNAFISSYSVEGAVGGFPTASVKCTAMNRRAYSNGVAQEIPALNSNGNKISGVAFTLPNYTDGSANKAKVIKPQDITVDISNAGSLFNTVTGVCVQSFSISYDLNRESIQCLGSKVPKSKKPQFPINIQLSVDVLSNEIVEYNLVDFLCDTGVYDASVTLRKPNCQGTGDIAAKYILRNLSLEGESWATSAGSSETKTITMLGQVAASGDLANGIAFSGISSYA